MKDFELPVKYWTWMVKSVDTDWNVHISALVHWFDRSSAHSFYIWCTSAIVVTVNYFKSSHAPVMPLFLITYGNVTYISESIYVKSGDEEQTPVIYTDAVIECVLDGIPVPVIRWEKDTVELTGGMLLLWVFERLKSQLINLYTHQNILVIIVLKI